MCMCVYMCELCLCACVFKRTRATVCALSTCACSFVQSVDWVAAEKSLQVDRTVKEVDWAVPGTKAGAAMLEEFIRRRLKLFGEKRNDPNVDALSNLSPWIHFG